MQYQSSSVYLDDPFEQRGDIKEKWVFGEMIEIVGADTLVVPISSTQKFQEKETKATRNYLFIHSDDRTFSRLFDKNDFVIQEFSTLTKNGKVDEDLHTIPICLYFVVYKTDTNKDKAIKIGDKATVALSKLDGSGYVEIEHDIDDVKSPVVLQEGSQLVLFYRKETNFYISKYDLNEFKKITERQIPIEHMPHLE